MSKKSFLSRARRLCGAASLGLCVASASVAWSAEQARAPQARLPAEPNDSGLGEHRSSGGSATQEGVSAEDPAAIIVYQPARATKAQEGVFVDNRPEVGTAEYYALKAAMDEELRVLKEVHPTWASLESRELESDWDESALTPQEKVVLAAQRDFYGRWNKLVRAPSPPPNRRVN